MVYLTIIIGLIIIGIVCIYYIYETNRRNKNNLKLNQIKNIICSMLMKDILYEEHKNTEDYPKHPCNYTGDYRSCMKSLYNILDCKNIDDERINKL